MKKGIVLIVAMLSFAIGFSQGTEKTNYKTTVDVFTKHYNNDNYRAIYNMLDDNFKKTFTLEKVNTFFKNEINAEALGKIKSRELKDIVRTGHTYIVTFENGTGEAFFLLDEENKIKGFQLSKK
ncbi:DUF3887 domain-containing protein [Mesoflavibacter zeaxanthinifaciens]|uniref:DUF3887 domain-containing protein n=1 Tax=Mesoflavibacter zeaxanthinifaciens TaxID=393060 RepID=UPI0026F035CC|nr:DUF3887 domain-containing protein [Mesoflavibacter zeaxanthinifaciens]